MAGRKANFQWESVPTVANHIWASTASNAVSFVDLGVFGSPGTIRRLIVDGFLMNPNDQDGIMAAGRLGVIVVAPQVVTVGFTAMPRPITDGERPWLWNRAYATNQEVLAGTTSLIKYIPLHLHDDVRGMRKYKENDHLVLVLENAIGAAIECMFSARMLTST